MNNLAKQQKTNDKKTIITQTSIFMDETEGLLYEEIFNHDEEKVQFIAWDQEKEKLVFKDFFKVETSDVDYIFKPILDDAVKKGAVLLPSNAIPYDTTKSLINEIETHIHKYVDLSDNFRRISSWYCLTTWLLDKIGTTSFLRAIGDYGTGKSRFLRVIGGLCYKPLLISGAVTTAPIYRMMDRWNGSLVIDEMDFKFTDETSEIAKILNCGNERGKPVMRCSKDDPNKIEFFDPFGPKIMVTRKKFQDQALESRCLTEIMKETNRKDIPIILTEEFYENEEILRNKLLMFRLQNWDKIKPTRLEEIDLGDIEPRLKQDIISFVTLFWNVDGMRQTFTDFVHRYSNELVEERSTSFEGMIVNSIFSLNPNPVTPDMNITSFTSQDIAEKMTELYNLENKPTPRKVGHYLKNILGLQTKHARIGAKDGRFLVWEPERMRMLRRKYVLSEKCDTSDVCDGIVGERIGNVTLDNYDKKPLHEKIMDVKSYIEKVVENGHEGVSYTALIDHFDEVTISKLIESTQLIKIPGKDLYQWSG